MSKYIWELENSDVLADRQEYAKRMKEYIAICEKRVSDMRIDKQNEVLASDDIKKIIALGDEEANKILKENLAVIESGEKKDKEFWDALIAKEEELIIKLKNKLAAYDIYQQKKTVVKCPTCQEVVCVCSDAFTKPDELKPDLPF